MTVLYQEDFFDLVSEETLKEIGHPLTGTTWYELGPQVPICGMLFAVGTNYFGDSGEEWRTTCWLASPGLFERIQAYRDITYYAVSYDQADEVITRVNEEDYDDDTLLKPSEVNLPEEVKQELRERRRSSGVIS